MGRDIKTIGASSALRDGRRGFRCVGLILMAACLMASGISYSVVTPQADALTRYTYTEYHMGGDARVIVFAPDQKTAENACIAAFARIAELDSIMSDYRKDSELMRLCDKAGGPAVPVSADLFKVLRQACEMSQRSGGAFDVTVGPLIQLWRKARKSGVLPNRVDIEKARRLVGWKKVELHAGNQTVRLKVAGMRLDLGGIAKGYADDEAQKVFRKFGITRALVEMGGDIVVTGPPPGMQGWLIRVPNAGDGHGPTDLRFSNCAVSTSGDTEQFVVIGGKRYSHVVDPRTGWALTSRAEITVVAPNGLTSDPLATALTVLSLRGHARLLKTYHAKAYFRFLSDR